MSASAWMALPAVGALAVLLSTADAAGLGAGWRLVGAGDWGWERDVRQVVRQGCEEGESTALVPDLTGSVGAWRCFVMPSLGTEWAGLRFLVNADGSGGFACGLGGGFALRDASGKVLWEDKWAPWHVYQPYVIEAIVERGRVRAQVFEWDAKTLVSQGPWVEAHDEATERQGRLGFATVNGIARFWGWDHGDTPLSPIVEDAPNKRRLAQGENPEWVIVGPGNWMFTDAKRQWVRQYATVERSSALNRTVRGAHRVWRCRVRVSPGAGGAGMLFQANEAMDQGFICWLGGEWGRGSLMLYSLPTKALWSGAQDNWHYDTEYVLEAETQPGKVRARLLAADGEKVVQETPWIAAPEAETAREGMFGYMTWKGSAEFAEVTAPGAAVATAPMATTVSSALGAGWQTVGEGKWQWADAGHTRLKQLAAASQVSATTSAVRGIHGVWRCRVKVPTGTAGAGLLFQASPDVKEGWACVLDQDGLKLNALGGRTPWQEPKRTWRPDTEYVLEGHVATDRVSVRLLERDGQTVLSECAAVYVSDKNNTREGVLGFTTLAGPAEFWDWSLK